MRYGMNLFLWTAGLHEEMIPILEALASMGFDGVEVPIFDTSLDYDAWGRRITDMGLSMTAVAARTVDDNPASSDAAVRAKAVSNLKAEIDCCAALGAERLVGPLHSALGHFTGVGPTNDEWAWVVEVLAEVAEHAGSTGVSLSLEPLNRFECYLLNSQADGARLVRDIGSPHVSVLYDTFHANIEEKTAAGAIADCVAELGHVHISENDRSTPGQGNVAWDETFRALAEAHYDGWLTIEAFGQGLPELAAATCIWRPMFESELQVAEDGLAFMKAKVAQHFA